MFGFGRKSVAQTNKQQATLQKNRGMTSFFSLEKKPANSPIKIEDAEIISMNDEDFQQTLNKITDNHQREHMLLVRLQHLQRMALELTQQLANLQAHKNIQSNSFSMHEI